MPVTIIEASEEAFTTGLVMVTEVEAVDFRSASAGGMAAGAMAAGVMGIVGVRTVAVSESATDTVLGTMAAADITGDTMAAAVTDDVCRV